MSTHSIMERAFIAAALLAAPMLAGCNTTAGFGRDVSATGRAPGRSPRRDPRHRGDRLLRHRGAGGIQRAAVAAPRRRGGCGAIGSPSINETQPAVPTEDGVSEAQNRRSRSGCQADDAHRCGPGCDGRHSSQSRRYALITDHSLADYGWKQHGETPGRWPSPQVGATFVLHPRRRGRIRQPANREHCGNRYFRPKELLGIK